MNKYLIFFILLIIDIYYYLFQISHAIKRWVRIGHEIEEGEDIENAIKDLSGTYISHLEPDRDKGKYLVLFFFF